VAGHKVPTQPVSDLQRSLTIDVLAGLQRSELGFREGFGAEFEVAFRSIDLDDRQATACQGDAISQGNGFSLQRSQLS
jgi:hypothetical protein